ncbi:MAG: hypothetical protein KDI79_20580 [Anaerolineae bacterium]|nr:hypothetical protein [Anaerolineae bacterium]
MLFSRILSKKFYILVVTLGVTCIAVIGFWPPQVKSAAPPGLVTIEGSLLVRHGRPFEVRGVNYYPKDFAWDKFWTSYKDPVTSTQINEELNRAKSLGINTVRIFLPYKLFDGSDQAYLDHLADLSTRLESRDMVAIVTLFDFFIPATRQIRTRQRITWLVPVTSTQ